MLLSTINFGKVLRMNLGKIFAGLASAAILAAVMLFAPAPAQAHTGHEHGMHSSHVQHMSTTKQQAANTAEATVSKTASQQMSTYTDGERGDHQNTSNCVGGCCGNGLGCCGAVMITAQQALPDFAHQSAIAPLDFDYGTGIDPDALKRPPRTFA